MICEGELKGLFIAWANSNWESWLYRHSQRINTKGGEGLAKDDAAGTLRWKSQGEIKRVMTTWEEVKDW